MTVPESFIRITPLCSAGRRALWMRDGGSEVELRAGREGDDNRILLKEGQVLAKKDIADLVELLLTVQFGLET
jgi:hypothetical protein